MAMSTSTAPWVPGAVRTGQLAEQPSRSGAVLITPYPQSAPSPNTVRTPTIHASDRIFIRSTIQPDLGMSVRIGTASKIDVIAKHCPMLPDPDPAAAVVAVAAHAGGEACMCDLTEPVAFAADGLAPHEGCWSTPGC
jgi:hypothetical protein